MADIVINGNQYRIAKKLSAMEQFHCTRRLGPALVICGVTFSALMAGEKVSLDDWVAVAGPVMEVIGRMSDEDVEYVINTSMTSVERMQGGVWAPVLAPDKKTMMFADMDQGELIRLTVEVLRSNLANFMKGMADVASLNDASQSDHP